MRPLLLAVSGGVASAVLYLSVLTGSLGALILAYMAPLPLLMLGLSGGFAPVLIGGGAGMLGVAVVAGPMAALAYAITNLLPSAVVVRQALLARRTEPPVVEPPETGTEAELEWYPPGRLVMVLAGLGAALVAVAALLFAGEPGGIEMLARDFLASSLGGLTGPGQAGLPDADIVSDGLARVLPAIVAISWLTMMIVNGVLAQGVLMRFGLNRRPPMRMADLALPPAAPVVLAILGLSALVLPGTTGYVALNAAIIMVVPFFFAGLAVVHAFAQGRGTRVPILVAFYFFLLLFQWPIPLVICLGMIEQWAGLRRRLVQAGPNQEDKK